MSKQSGKSYRYELVHGEDADFVADQRNDGNGRWAAAEIDLKVRCTQVARL